MYEKLIRPFVKRQICIPRYDHPSIGAKYNFFNHPHHILTFTAFSASTSSSHDQYARDDDDDDDDDFDSIPRWEFICDGCTLPIQEKKQTDDDYDDYENGYMSCDECKYFLHLSCFNLPLEIPSLPVHSLKDHSLSLQNVGRKLSWDDWIECNICISFANGLYYACTYKGCQFKLDVACASLPNTIKHTSHPRHNYLKLVPDDDIRSGVCANCHWPISERKVQYRCNSCRFYVCVRCVMLSATNKHNLEKHLLPLTFDVRVNRPGDFYCSTCEDQMDPREWMYHCRDCDQSFHTDCFPATTWCRNIKFGTEHVISGIHDHPLRYQIITNKKRCDLCHEDYYDYPGFQCASCFFVVCKKISIFRTFIV